MKFKSLMDIPVGYEMELVNEGWRFSYTTGTIVVRGSADAQGDNEFSVAFTFPDGDWHYLDETEIREIQNKEDVHPAQKSSKEETFTTVIHSMGVFDSAGNCVADICESDGNSFEITISQYITNADEWPKIAEKIQQCLVRMKGE